MSINLSLTDIPWEIATKITTPLMLVALCAVLYYAWRLQRIRAYTQQLKVLPSKDRAELARRLAEHYGVPVSGLAPADRVAIVMRELETKHSERRHNASLAFGAFALACILWFTSTLLNNRSALQRDDDQVWVQGNVYDADGTPIERDAFVSVPGQPGSFPTTENGLFSFRISRAALLTGDSVELYVRAYGKALVDTGKVGNHSNRLRFPTRARRSDDPLADTAGTRQIPEGTSHGEVRLPRSDSGTDSGLSNATTTDNGVGIFGRNIPTPVMNELRSRIRDGHRISDVAFFPPSGYVLIEDEHTPRYAHLPQAVENKLRGIASEGKRIRRILTFPSSPSSWLVLYGDNEWDGQGLPRDLIDKLYAFRDWNRPIRDVTLLPGGGWLIIDGNDGVVAVNGGELEQRIRESARQRSRPVVKDRDTWFFLRGRNDGVTHGIGDDLGFALTAVRTPNTSIVTFAFTPAGGWILLADHNRTR